jgi:hypothetical protein
MTISEKVHCWKENNLLKDSLIARKEMILEDLSGCLGKQGVNDFKFKYGSLVLKGKVHYSPLEVFELLGKEAIIRSSSPELDRVEEYAARGFLNKSELKKYRQIVDVNEQFILMDVNKEENCREWWTRRLKKLSELSTNKFSDS